MKEKEILTLERDALLKKQEIKINLIENIDKNLEYEQINNNKIEEIKRKDSAEQNVNSSFAVKHTRAQLVQLNIINNKNKAIIESNRIEINELNLKLENVISEKNKIIEQLTKLNQNEVE